MVLVYYKLWYSFSGNFSWKLKANNDSVTIYTALSIGISSTYAYLLQYTNVLIYNIIYIPIDLCSRCEKSQYA